MGKAGKWIKNLLIGKKDKVKEKEKDGSNLYSPTANQAPATPIAVTPGTPKEKRRWSFRRSPGTGTPTKESNAVVQTISESENGQNEEKKHEMAMVAATTVAVDAAMVAAQAAAEVIKLTTPTPAAEGVEEASAIRIQSYFRSYLARKALCALKGLVKLQALVRGHLVRRQATATLRCMQALVTVQARARAQRIQMVEDGELTNKRSSIHRRSPQDNRFRQTYDELERGMEENVKIVEMDSGEAKGGLKSRHSYSNHQQIERVIDHRFSTYYPREHVHPNQDQPQISPVPSALTTDMSPRTCSGHFEEDYSFTTAQSSPQYYSAVSSKQDPLKIPFAFPRPEDCQFYPNYMANTQSFKAKVRSQSAPKQRPDSYERQPSRRRASIEGRNVPRAVRMQRSSSHLGPASQGQQNPWSIKLDRSMVSLKDSECGSTSTVLTNTTYYRSVATYDQIHGNRY